ncbi:MAG: RHS repeat-associated core domain-containing protein, partial [Candidatus Heimdallarchaeota archaeon]
TVVQSYVYDSFGQIISQIGSIQNPFTYTAREYNSETGLYYYRARYYGANMGRFTSEDPIGIKGGINLYAYAANNPVKYVDPCGSWIIKWCVKRITKYFIGKTFDGDLEDPAERDDDGDGTPNFKDPDSPLCIVNCEPTAPTPEPPTPEPPAPEARCQRAK